MTEVTAEDWLKAFQSIPEGLQANFIQRAPESCCIFFIPVVLEAEPPLMKDPYSVWYEGV